MCKPRMALLLCPCRALALIGCLDGDHAVRLAALGSRALASSARGCRSRKKALPGVGELAGRSANSNNSSRKLPDGEPEENSRISPGRLGQTSTGSSSTLA